MAKCSQLGLLSPVEFKKNSNLPHLWRKPLSDHVYLRVHLESLTCSQLGIPIVNRSACKSLAIGIGEARRHQKCSAAPAMMLFFEMMLLLTGVVVALQDVVDSVPGMRLIGRWRISGLDVQPRA